MKELSKSLKSMTGFARVSYQDNSNILAFELRSVNHRYLEFSFRIPEQFRNFELKIRDKVSQFISRGKIDCTFTYQSVISQRTTSLNENTLNYLQELCQKINNYLPVQPSGIVEWLKFPGILENQILPEGEIEQLLDHLLAQTLQQLIVSREQEGKALRQFLLDHVEKLQLLLCQLKQLLPNLLEKQKERLQERLNSILQDTHHERFHQEMALLVQRSDTSEELHRFNTHLTEIKNVLEQGGVIGRRLDFLIQELQREASTMGAKSLSTESSHLIIEIKLLIEQLREQVQNVE